MEEKIENKNWIKSYINSLKDRGYNKTLIANDNITFFQLLNDHVELNLEYYRIQAKKYHRI